jgi:RNA polymerase sigma-70 factor
MENCPPHAPRLDDAALARAYEAGTSAWPGLALPREELACVLVSRRVDVATASPAILKDLFLARACARNVPGALRAFREQFLAVVALAVRRFDDTPSFTEEVYQHLCEVLFVDGPKRKGRIDRYDGSGTLAGFVGTAARRIAMRTVAGNARFQGEEALIEQLTHGDGQETAMVRLQHRETFNRALSVALRQLPRRERLILRMNLVERISTTRIAAMYKVSQPTVSRWLQRTAQTIFEAVKDLVCDELDVDTRELESLLLEVRSQIEITVLQASGSINPQA